jgi:hypothetical protein
MNPDVGGEAAGRGEQSMNRNSSVSSRRKTVVMLTAAIVFCIGILLFVFLVSGGNVLSMLVASAILVILGCCHYLIWGHRLGREVGRVRKPQE